MQVLVTHVVGFTALMIVYCYTLVWESQTSYMTSPLWLDIPIVPHIVVLQILSVACLFAWVGVVEQRSTSPLMVGASIGYYAFSTLWPTLAKRFLERPTHASALFASFPLWGAGAMVLLLLHASTQTLERLLLVPLVVLTVVCDAVLWTAAALRRGRR